MIASFYSAQAQQKTSGPFLEVLSENAMIPLLKSTTEAQISGAIAHVKITQVYHNEGIVLIEAIYVFPLSTQAAVHNMQMRIGDRVVNAKIFEKQQAKQVYASAIKEGKRAAKLDQSRPNVFQIKAKTTIGCVLEAVTNKNDASEYAEASIDEASLYVCL